MWIAVWTMDRSMRLHFVVTRGEHLDVMQGDTGYLSDGHWQHRIALIINMLANQIDTS